MKQQPLPSILSVVLIVICSALTGRAQTEAPVTDSTTQQTCQFTLAPLSQTFGATGGTGSFTVSTSANCDWNVRSLASWITITSAASGKGNTTVFYSVAPSYGGRQGEISLNGRRVTVTQSVMTCPEPSFKLGGTFVPNLGSPQIALKDFNADGIYDIWSFGGFSADFTAALYVATGKREGGFNAATSLPLNYKPTSGLTRGAIADFNRDGKQDFVLIDSSFAYLSMNNGAGSLGTAAKYSINIGGFDVATGDFTGDQYPDVLVSSETNALLALYVNDKTGKLNSPILITLTETNSPAIRIEMGDFNTDGKLDLIYLVKGSFEFMLLRGNGAGGFERGSLYRHIDNTITGFVEPRAITLGDLTGDGRTDVIIVNNKGVAVAPGVSTGGFGNPTMYLLNQSAYDAFVGDFNGDGLADLAATSGLVLHYLRGLGGNRLAEAEQFLIRGSYFSNSDAIALDWNADGLTDIGFTTPNVSNSSDPQGLAVTFGNRVNGFTSPKFKALPLPTAPHLVETADVNADGMLDLVAAYGLDTTPNSGRIAILYGKGNGQFQAGPTYTATRPFPLVLADVNQDGAPDLIFQNDNASKVSVWRNNGLGAFTLASEPEISSGIANLSTADFNNDGRLDIFVTISSETPAQLLAGNGNGTFTSIKQALTGSGSTAGDFNGDGNQDIATWTRCGLGTGASPVVIWSGNGAGGFTESTRLTAADPLSALVAKDLNGDGKADLIGNLCTASANAYLLVAFANANGFGPFVPYEGAGKTTALADFNGDGLPDIPLQNRAYLNRGDGTLQASGYGFYGNVAGDFNEDGLTDTIWFSGKEYAFIPNQARCATASDAVVTTSASYYSLKPAINSIASVFGSGLASETRVAGTIPLPTSLAGASVNIRDSQGTERNAPLFFVSPNQINLLIPDQAASGLAQVTVLRNGSTVTARGVIEILPVNPGLFTIDASGIGYPAGATLKVRSNGNQVYEPLAQFNATQNRYIPTTLDVSNTAEQVYLILFGTGLRNRTSLNNVTVTIGGLPVEVLYVGAQGGFIGLDQINLRVPSTLTGRGEVEVLLTVDGRITNPLKVVIK